MSSKRKLSVMSVDSDFDIKRMARVLVISETLEEAEQIHHMIAQANLNDITFRYPENLAHEPPEPGEIFKDCCDVIREEGITSILSVLPKHVLIHAALLKEFPDMPGPSFESAFLSLHRFYCKELITNGFNVMYSTVDIEDITKGKTGLAGVLEETGSPAWVRDSYRLPGCLVKKVKNISQLQDELDEVQMHLKIKMDSLRPFLLHNLDKDKYSRAFEASCLVEQYLFMAKQSFSFHYVEGCIIDKAVVPWAVTDVFYLRQKPKRIQYVCLPSRLSDSTQYQVWGVFRELAQRLCTYGYNNQFIHCEVLVTKNAVVKVVDVVPTVNSEVSLLYRQVLQGGDNIKAQIEVSMGLMQRTPRALPQRSAMLGFVHITKPGMRLGDVMDVKEARATPGVSVHQTNEEHIVQPANDDGERIFDVLTQDTTMENCLKRNREISSSILKGACERADAKSKSVKKSRKREP